MKKLIILLALGSLLQFKAASQSEDFALLCSLYENIEKVGHGNFCSPWASSMRLVNLKKNNVVERNLFKYEDLWIALQKTCLKEQRVSTRLVVQLDKKGRITSLEKNGQIVDLHFFPKLKRKRFKQLRSNADTEVKIYTKIG